MNAPVRTPLHPVRVEGDAVEAVAAACEGLDGPVLALHVPTLRRNAADLVRRAGGTPIRIASKSVRVRWVLSDVLGRTGVQGVMGYSPREARWLVDHGIEDVLLGYPSVDRAGLASLHGAPVTLMVDDVAQLDFAPPGASVCLDVDASLRLGRVHLGVRRSPLRTPEQVAALAGRVAARGFRVRGVMFYEAQVAGLPDTSAAVRLVKRLSLRDLAIRRAAVVRAVTAEVGPLDLVNSGGSGSVAASASDPVVTEVTAGSGLYVPTLFDGYRSFRPDPSLFFALPVVRRPTPGVVTAAYGGYVASGPPGSSRVPTPVWPRGLGLLRAEAAGEVQTPLRGGSGLHVGDAVWFRAAKAGEVCERFDAVHLVDDTPDGPAVVDVVPTYRGEGRTFG
ncbi:amino acid deaminase/aldolase [Jatrophihabitans sp. YIM 134969]